eukprot:PhM_4_TR15179/c3_g1_i1/m.67070/K01110/PTEN; phosphatidylinositol-3,4,5-trisphosphate 3-phosphatase and dual-specificity protein phosphatase PTEN
MQVSVTLPISPIDTTLSSATRSAGSLSRTGGWLWKHSTGRSLIGRKNWNRRYFRMTDTELVYYTNHTLKEQKGAIPFKSIVRTFSDAPISGSPPTATATHSFAVQFKPDAFRDDVLVLLLTTEDAEDRDDWIEELRVRHSAALMEDSSSSPPCASPRAYGDDCDQDDDYDEENFRTVSPTSQPSQPKWSCVLNGIRTLVSGNKRRLQNGNYNLDLTYVTDRIIAMGYPSEGREALFRNPLDEVAAFLTHHHGSNFKVYNLCSERAYGRTTFDGRFARYPFDDHNAPPLHLMPAFVADAKQWLDADDKNVVAVHCKAGKGRTGVFICCLLSALQGLPPGEALAFYGAARTTDGKGVTIPSQIRYVRYFWNLLHHPLDESTPPEPIRINRVLVKTVPHFDRSDGCDPFFVVKVRSRYHKHRPLGHSSEDVHDPLVTVYDQRDESVPPRIKASRMSFVLEPKLPIAVADDVRLGLYNADPRGRRSRQEFMCGAWFNTHILLRSIRSRSKSLASSTNSAELSFTLSKSELDGACKDDKCESFDRDFSLTVFFTIGTGTPITSELADPSTITTTTTTTSTMIAGGGEGVAGEPPGGCHGVVSVTSAALGCSPERRFRIEDL